MGALPGDEFLLPPPRDLTPTTGARTTRFDRPQHCRSSRAPSRVEPLNVTHSSMFAGGTGKLLCCSDSMNFPTIWRAWFDSKPPVSGVMTDGIRVRGSES